MIDSTQRLVRHRRQITICAGAAWVATVSATSQVEVSAELELLMSQFGFEVQGMEQTEAMWARIEGSDLVTRLRVLLDEFDHVIVQDGAGGVDRVIILGEKVAVVAPPMVAETPGFDLPDDDVLDQVTGELGDAIILQTQRQGHSHLVSLILEGNNGQRIPQTLLIDTGSDHVVLPNSLIASLGLSPNDLRPQTVQTANGTVDARIGTLQGLFLDSNNRVEGVSVAFIDDTRLGGNALLGMSLLGRFLVTIDDEKSQVTLASP
ncbi:peptidase A2A [Thiocapsa imhoffii]|uniref:Peptidase A2A n=1 Tax=Thiocapsa imhoffii TaxID=382777 RepID=A0A9X0WK04_9GAMM|nr:retropepsin-like aspartic protease [Thiocapsa imhoffii]MBK1645926.1 peptidase A2A [Thiocapsa imhoffii]